MRPSQLDLFSVNYLKPAEPGDGVKEREAHGEAQPLVSGNESASLSAEPIGEEGRSEGNNAGPDFALAAEDGVRDDVSPSRESPLFELEYSDPRDVVLDSEVLRAVGPVRHTWKNRKSNEFQAELFSRNVPKPTEPKDAARAIVERKGEAIDEPGERIDESEIGRDDGISDPQSLAAVRTGPGGGSLVAGHFEASVDGESERVVGGADGVGENGGPGPGAGGARSLEPAHEAGDGGAGRGGSGALVFGVATPAQASRDYRITQDSFVGDGSLREKAWLNIEAIQLLKAIEAAGREASEQEKNALARYSGWGALPAAFDYYTGREDEWNEVRDRLKALLTQEEYEAARASVPNSHYTSPLVVEAMWSALERLGVGAGARILEPSVGVGNFLGLMPQSLMPGCSRAGVELDSITARMAKLLYPDSTIFESGFEEAAFPDQFFDVAIGNVPFGNYGVHDDRYKAWQTSSIHDYFFVKSLDTLRPGGVLAFISSRYTMDKESDRIREHLASQADLLAAVRLPNTTFKDNAGTVVTTDIIFLQKRGAGQAPGGAPWRQVLDYRSSPEQVFSFSLNEYYVRNPDMMLGSMELVRGSYAREQAELIGDITKAGLEAAIAALPRDVYAPRAEPLAPTVLSFIGNDGAFAGVKNGAFVIVDDVLGIRQDGQFVPASLTLKAEARVRGMMKVRDYVRGVFETQLADNTDEVIAEARRNLDYTYDRFVEEFGYLSNVDNRRAFASDPDAPLLLSLEEDYDGATGRARKAAIFERPTLERYRPVEHVDTAAEALAVSLNEHGRLDWSRMEAVTGRAAAALQQELGPLVYENPESGRWETADAYLSGNVRHKLAVARAAAAIDKKYHRNIAPLEGAQPADLTPGEISARLGSTWIPTDDLGDFVADVIEASHTAVRVDYVPEVATWAVTAKPYAKSNVANTTTYGTERFTAIDLIEDALNGKVPTAYDSIPGPDGDKRVINEARTLEAREAQQKLKDKFAEWIWQDAQRAARLAEIYNEKFNSVRLRSYDGSHMTFPGMNKSILRKGDLDPHQKNAVWRILQGGSTLLAHCVGAGKTWIMTAAVMEARRIGLAKKSMVVVPNHLVEQWGKAFLQLYPQANIFVAGKEHFQGDKRAKAMSRIATGTFDAVIVSHKSFELLPVSDALFDGYMQEELEALEKAIREASADKSSRRIVKILEADKKRLVKRIEDRAKREKKDKTVTFEELGITNIFVDEADLYKNLGFTTKMARVAGLPNSNSNRAADMHIKTRYLRKQNNGKGVVFATGTPISNTMAELYTMKRYLAPEALEAAGMAAFDAWAANFGETVTSLEVTPDGGGYRMKTRFAKFVNLPELLTMFRDFADVQTADMLNLPRPALKGGQNKVVVAPSTPELKTYVASLVKRADRIKSGSVDPRDDNMLKITSDGRKAALDMRLVDPFATVHPESKVNLVINEVFTIWKETEQQRATQLVFCDLSTPSPDRFHVYGAIRSGLIERGVPVSEIDFIHDADTDAAKQALFEKVNSGRGRILLGSTEKMGAGTNVQRFLYASHNVDAPWRPRDIEQRDGRILRPGNTHPGVLIFRFVTEGSFDAYMWQTLEAKARFIQQVMNGETSVRTAEDITGGALTYAEIKAIASGNPAVMEKVKVDTEVRKLDSLRTSHAKRKFEIRRKIGVTQTRIAGNEEQLAMVGKDIATREANTGEQFAMTLAGRRYTGKEGREQAAKELNGVILTLSGDAEAKCRGQIAGFDIMTRATPNREVTAYLRGFAAYTFHHNPENALGTIMSIERTLRGFEAIQGRLESDIARDQKELAEYRVESEKPFEYEEQLKQLLVKQAQLNAELDLGKDDKQAVTAESEGGAAKAELERQVLEDQPVEIFRAASDGEKIHSYLQSLQQQQSVSDEQRQADKQEIIKEYDRLVDGPAARKQLEQTNPALVTARDQAIVELRREKLQKETAERQHKVARVRR
jgi:N12 class adenine-specific DNA methylase